MNPKQKNIKMHLFYALMQLLLWDLDELKTTTPRMQKLKEDLTEMCELLNNEVADTYTLQKTTYFQELTNKISTLIRKSFDPNM